MSTAHPEHPISPAGTDGHSGRPANSKSDGTNTEARLRAILETAVDGIITIDETGVIESNNKAAETIFGYSKGELIGQNIAVLMPLPYHDEHGGYLKRYLETNEKHIIGIGREVTAKRKDGSVFPIELSVSEVFLDERRLFTGFVRDITQRKQTEDRLLQAERLAAIGTAITGLAHESRNALARSQASLEMLLRRIQDRPDAVELAERVQSAQDDLHRLYEEVREYAAPLRLNLQRSDLHEILHEAWSHLRICQSEKRAEMRESCLDSGQDGPLNTHCRVDRFAIRQVFRNIIENALAACHGPAEISVAFSAADLQGSAAVRVAIRDNGPGLTDEVKQRVFEEFYTTKTHGTGLGLAICKRMVEAHHGRIEVGSHGRAGTEIIVTLPR